MSGARWTSKSNRSSQEQWQKQSSTSDHDPRHDRVIADSEEDSASSLHLSDITEFETGHDHSLTPCQAKVQESIQGVESKCESMETSYESNQSKKISRRPGWWITILLVVYIISGFLPEFGSLSDSRIIESERALHWQLYHKIPNAENLPALTRHAKVSEVIKARRRDLENGEITEKNRKTSHDAIEQNIRKQITEIGIARRYAMRINNQTLTDILNEINKHAHVVHQHAVAMSDSLLIVYSQHSIDTVQKLSEKMPDSRLFWTSKREKLEIDESETDKEQIEVLIQKLGTYTYVATKFKQDRAVFYAMLFKAEDIVNKQIGIGQKTTKGPMFNKQSTRGIYLDRLRYLELVKFSINSIIELYMRLYSQSSLQEVCVNVLINRLTKKEYGLAALTMADIVIDDLN